MEQVGGFQGDLNNVIVGSGPEHPIFDSVPRSEMIRSLASDASPTLARMRIKNCRLMLMAGGAGILLLEVCDLNPAEGVQTEPEKVAKIGQAVLSL